MVAQMWTVLLTLAAYVCFEVSMLFVSDRYRNRILDTSAPRVAAFLIAFFVLAYAVVAIVACTGASCPTLSWTLTSAVVLGVFAVVLGDMYLLVATKDDKSVGAYVYDFVCRPAPPSLSASASA